MDLTELTLETIAGRRAPVVFEALLEKVLQNMQDPNTDPEATREITLKFKFKPLKSRQEAAIKLIPTYKLAPLEAEGGHLFMRSVGGKMTATTHDTRQEELDLEGGVDIVDTGTGEIVGSIGNTR